MTSTERVLFLCSMLIGSTGSAFLCSECQPQTLKYNLPRWDCDPATNRTLRSGRSITISQCFGSCPSGLCLPTLTRVRRIRKVDVVEHVDCECRTLYEPPGGVINAQQRLGYDSSEDRNIISEGFNKTDYKVCLACKEQVEYCEAEGKVYDSDVCHCVPTASRTFLNSFYTLGVVMLTIMVCCFLVFGVQRGEDNNVLAVRNRSPRTRRSRRCLNSLDNGAGDHGCDETVHCCGYEENGECGGRGATQERPCS